MFNSESSNMKNYVMLGAGIVMAGAAIYFLSQDGDMIKYDPKTHTVQELRHIVHEVYVHQISLIQQKYRLILDQKAGGKLDDTILENIRTKYAGECAQGEEEIYKNAQYNDQFVTEWMEKHKDDKEIQDMISKMQDLEEQVFCSIEDTSISHMKCKNIPTFIGAEELSKDGCDATKHESDTGNKRKVGDLLNEADYLQIFRKSQAKYRYELHKIINGKVIKQLTDDEVEQTMKLYKRRRQFEVDAMKLFGFKMDDNDDRKPELVIEECYLDFQTKSLQPGAKGGPFHKRVQVEQKEHGQQWEKMTEGGVGRPMPNLEDKKEGNGNIISADPMLSRNSDVVIDLAGVEGYQGLSKQKTFMPASQARVQINEKTNYRVKKFISKLKNAVALRKISNAKKESADTNVEAEKTEEVKITKTEEAPVPEAPAVDEKAPEDSQPKASEDVATE